MYSEGTMNDPSESIKCINIDESSADLFVSAPIGGIDR
jgi:hypothetical protein